VLWWGRRRGVQSESERRAPSGHVRDTVGGGSSDRPEERLAARIRRARASGGRLSVSGMPAVPSRYGHACSCFRNLLVLLLRLPVIEGRAPVRPARPPDHQPMEWNRDLEPVCVQ